MSECKSLEPLFTSYVDGTAVPVERASVEAHLDRCPACRARVSAEQAARQVLVARRKALGACAPSALQERCRRQRQEALKAGRAVATTRRWVPMSLAATLLLAVASVFLFSNQSVSALATQLTVDHMKCFRLGTAGSTTDPRAAAAEWGRTYGWTIAVPASSSDRQLEFMCLRRCVVAEGRAAHMMYEWHGQPLSVFVMPRHVGHNTDTTDIFHRFGREAVTWSSGDRQYVVVVEGRPPDLDALVKYVRASAR